MKKTVAILTALLIGSTGVLTYANGSADLSAEVVTWGYNSGITKYNSSAAFNPSAPVTREQAAKMIVTLIGQHHQLGFSIPAEINCTFNDAASIDSSLTYGVESACGYGLFKGYKGNFMPKNYITYEDARTLISRAIAIVPQFTDYKDAITVSLQGNVTRGELLKALFTINTIVEARKESDKEIALEKAQAELNAAIVLWNSKGVKNYTVRQQLSCFCTPNSTHPIGFEVKDGAVVSGSVQDVNETDKIAVSELTSEPKTVGEMFLLIQDGIDREADSINVTYDATYGYPKQINIDYSTMMADEEMYYTYEVTVK